jgi:sugar lactone lactonase YvrE
VATATQLNVPFGLVLDGSNNWIFTDSGNQRLRRIDAGSSLVTSLAGTGTGGFNGDGSIVSTQLNGPAGVAVESSGTILVADSLNHRVRRINVQTGQVTTIAGTGVPGYNGDNIAAVTAHLNLPTGVAVEASGDILIADSFNNRVRRVHAGTGLISTVAGTGLPGFNGDAQAADQAQLSMPMGVALDKAGNILIADLLNHRVRTVNIQTGEIQTIIGTGVPGFNGDGHAAAATQINAPLGLAVDSNGNLLLTESGGMRVRRIAF